MRWCEAGGGTGGQWHLCRAFALRASAGRWGLRCSLLCKTGRSAPEGREAKDHFVEQDPKGPPIHLAVVACRQGRRLCSMVRWRPIIRHTQQGQPTQNMPAGLQQIKYTSTSGMQTHLRL